MELIKVLLLVAFLGLLLWAFRNRRRVGLRAGARVLLIALTAFASASVIDTGIPQRLADLVGVTRGTDLVLYTLVVVFAMTSAGLYFRCRDIELRIAEIARVVALHDAISADGPPEAPGRHGE